MRRSGYHVITTCSKHNFDYVKSLGADAVFDYRDPDVGKKINDYTQNKLLLAWDTISLEDTARICSEALSQDGKGARYGSILQVKLPRDDVEVKSTIMYTVSGAHGFKDRSWLTKHCEDLWRRIRERRPQVRSGASRL